MTTEKTDSTVGASIKVIRATFNTPTAISGAINRFNSSEFMPEDQLARLRKLEDQGEYKTATNIRDEAVVAFSANVAKKLKKFVKDNSVTIEFDLENGNAKVVES